MSYSNQTPNFGLPQYALGDTPEMNDLNIAFGTIDSNLGKGSGGGAVESVFGRAGKVTAQAGDYTAEMVGAIPNAAGAVSTESLEDKSVTTAKIADGAITAEKLADGLVIGGGGISPQILVTVRAESQVICTDGNRTFTKTSEGIVTFDLPSFGTWTVTAALGEDSVSKTVSVTEVKQYFVKLVYANIFGVVWDEKSQSTALTRLTEATDPNGYVNVDITAEPVPAVGTGAGSSPFDAYMPWSGMEEYNIIDNVVTYKRGDVGFSRTNFDTMVYVPTYYYRIERSTDNKRYFYVSDKAEEGFEKHPGSGKYPGRYATIAGYFSKSGAAPLASITRATARAGSIAKGDGWSQYDYATWCAVWLLFLVEFADWDSQKVVGRGYVDAGSTGAAQKNGLTDSMVYHTGRAAGTDGMTCIQYRHLENVWGNIWHWVDGLNLNENASYICLDHFKYADDTTEGFTDTGIIFPGASGYITALGMSNEFPWAFLPTAIGGSETTYITDYVTSAAAGRVFFVGGRWNSTSSAGLWLVSADSASSFLNAGVGARLLYHPSEEELK